MARKNRKSQAAEGMPSPAPESAPPQLGSALGPALADQTSRTMRRVVLVVILSIFAIFMVTVVALFSGGESIQWKKELAGIDARFARGEHAAAADELEKFGNRWPDSLTTVPWNQKAGNYFAAAGNWEKAAQYFRRAVEIDDALLQAKRVPGPTAAIRARAGEAFMKSGREDEARSFFEAELKVVSRAVGDHDLANYGLGVIHNRAGRLDQALQNFESISDREKYKTEKEEFYNSLKKEILDPVREESRTISADLL